MATSNNASSTVSASVVSTSTTTTIGMNVSILSTILSTIVTSLGNAFPPATRKLTTRSARRLAALIAFRAYGGDKFVKALATTATADHTSRVMIEAATIAATCVTSAAQEVLSAMARATRTDTAVLMGLMPLMARALRPVTITRAARKAAARKAMAKASRKANRARKSVSRRTPRVVVIRSPQPISRNRGFVGIALRRSKATTRTRTHVGIARRTIKVQAPTSVPTYRMLEVVAAMRRANRLARIAAKASRRAARNAQKVITVGVGRTYTVPAPVLVDKVHTCAVPSPVLLDKTVQVESAPLATQRPEVVSYRRPTRKALVTTAIEVEPVVATIEKAVKVLSLAEKEAARDAKAAYKEAYSKWQAACVAAKAAYKKANPHASSKDKGANPKGKKNNGGGGNRKREQYTPPQRPEILSQRADLNIKAGPTDSNDYGWTPMSEMELASFFYGEEVDGVAIADMGLSEVPTPMTSVPSRGDHDLYSMVVCVLIGRGAQGVQPAVTAADSSIIQPNNMLQAPGKLQVPQNVKLMYSNKIALYPAKAFTAAYHAIPVGFYALETGRVPFKSVKKSKSGTNTYTFSGEEGTYLLMENASNGSIFLKNSHIRSYTVNGEKKVFNDYLQLMLDNLADMENAALRNEVEACQEVQTEVATVMEGAGISYEEALPIVLEQFAELFPRPKKYVVIESHPEKNDKGVIEYKVDLDALTTIMEQYEGLGYEVVSIESSLLLGNITATNFRLDGVVPCQPIESGVALGLSEHEGIKSWDASNIHRSVTEVTDLRKWLDGVMATVKAISFSFNTITEMVEVPSVVNREEGVAHTFSLTTLESTYDDFNVEVGSVPAWTINLWTTTPLAKGMLPEEQSKEAAVAARTFVPRGAGTAPSSSLRALLEKKKAQENARKGVDKNVTKVGPRNMNVIVPGAVGDIVMNDTVPAAIDDTISGSDSINKAAIQVTNKRIVVGASRNTYGASNGDNIDEVETVHQREVESIVVNANQNADLEPDLCQAIPMKDIAMSSNQLAVLTNLCVEFGIAIELLPAGDDLGSYLNGVISIVGGLGDNRRAQVLLHELLHAVLSNVDPDIVEVISTNWIDNVGKSSVTPTNASLEEQFAYSFMEYGHDLDTLVEFLRGIRNGTDGWDVAYNALETAITSKATLDVAPITIVSAAAEPSVENKSPILEALLNVENQDVLVLMDHKGNLPLVYSQAFPELLSIKELVAKEGPNGELLGSVITCTTNSGVKIHAICAVVLDRKNTHLDPAALADGLRELTDPDKTYICEPDLGLGLGGTQSPYILGAVRQALGQTKVKTISMPAMKRLAKEWSNAHNPKVYPKADLSLWPCAWMKGTAIVAVPVGSTATVFVGGVDDITYSTVYGTMAVINGDGTVNTEALAEGLAEVETYISNGSLPLPVHVYSNQLEAFKGLSVGVTPVSYAKGTFLPGVKVGVLDESPVKGEELSSWYYYLLDALKGGDNGMFNVSEMSSALYSKAFKAMGLPEALASYALSPLPLSWLQHGIVLVVGGKDAKGLIERTVTHEELIDEALLKVLVDRNIKVYTAVREWDKAAKKSLVKGVSIKVHGFAPNHGVYALPDGIEGEAMLQMAPNEKEYLNGNVIAKDIKGMASFTLDNYMQKHVMDTLQYLVDTQGVGMAIKYMMALLPNFVKKVTTVNGKERYHLSVYNLRNAAEYYMEFTPQPGKDVDSWDYLSPRHCSVFSRNADREVNAITNLAGFPEAIYDGVTVALALAISAGCGRKLTQDTLEGYLAGTTNLWARDDNYGLELGTIQTPNYSLTDTLEVIVNNSGKTISSTPNQNVDAQGVALAREAGARWPYFMPCNASLNLDVMQSLMKKGELVLCDKYAMERIIIGDGARAMLASSLSPEDAAKLAGYNEAYGLEMTLDEANGGIIYTVCWPTDKASKALNRPSQFHGSSQAGGWKEDLTWCPLTTKLGDRKRSGVRGFKRTMIAAITDFLTHGSGTATQHPDASVWSYAVNGSMSKMLHCLDVPAVQQNLDEKGNHKKGLRPHASIMGPDASVSGTEGTDLEGKKVAAYTWFCNNFSKKYLEKAINKAMYAENGELRVYSPNEEIIVLFDKMISTTGVEIEGYFPDGSTPGLPSSRLVLFSNDLGAQKCVITGYKILPMDRGESMRIVLNYATVMDTRDPSNEWSGAKARGLGIKFIISHDGTLLYIGNMAPYNGVETSLDELYANGAIHATAEALKGNYAFMHGFASAHGAAYMDGPYLHIDQYLMDGTVNPNYHEGDERMVSDLTDTESYFYQWLRSITRTVRIRKTINEDEWQYILACNKKSLDKHGRLPGVTVTHNPNAILWDAEDANGDQEVDDVATVTVEYDVQVAVVDYWVQVEVAPPGACTGNQGMTAEQAANLELMLKLISQRLWNDGAEPRKGVENAVYSAETHALVEAGHEVPGIFYFDPTNRSHNLMMEELLYQVSDTGVRTLRKAKDFYLLLAELFGGAAANTTGLWEDMLAGTVVSLDVVDGEKVGDPRKVVYYADGFNYLAVDGLAEHMKDALELGHVGQGLAIYTTSEEDRTQVSITYVDPTVFLQLGAFESTRIAADPKTHAPARTVTGAATGIVSDIHKAFLTWTTDEFWARKGSSSAVHAINRRLRNSMLGWIGVNSKQSTMMNSKGVLGRIARIDQRAGVAGKVCTGMGPQYAHHIVRDKDGVEVGKLPVAIIHPDCLLAKGLKHNDIIGVGRTPTVSLAFCVVKFSRTYGRMGYIHMSFSVWAKGNNGDTDGDPCNRFRVGGMTKKGRWSGCTYAQAIKLNKHALGMGGYNIVCGIDPSKHDCADFVSFSGMWTKKVLNNDPEMIPAAIREWMAEKGLKVKRLEPLVNLMLPSKLMDSAKKVAGHYRANVGVAYGWCSAYSAHMKEKHSFLEAVVTHLLKTAASHPQFVGMELPSTVDMVEALIDGSASTNYIIDLLCQYKADPTTNNPMDLVEMGQHVKVMLEASAWLWRGIYEGLGLSGYSPDASVFFEAFGVALRNNGRVVDTSIKDEDGKVTSIQMTAPNKLASVDNNDAIDSNSISIGEFIATHYLNGNLAAANEVFAACLLYNGYRTIERGQHVPGDDPKQATTLDVYTDMYMDIMGDWSDTQDKGGSDNEYIYHSVLAGVFRRAGQGTSGVSIDDEISDVTSAQMIYTFAHDLWAGKYNLDAEKPEERKGIFRNGMLNEIVTKSITLYKKLVSIASIGVYDVDSDY